MRYHHLYATRIGSSNGAAVARVVALLVSCVLSSGCAGPPKRPANYGSGPGYRSVIAYLTELIRYEMGAHDVPGVSVALVDRQEVVWAAGFGFADVERGVPVTERTRFRLASISKPVTAMAVMQLAEHGSLDIDAPIASYLPGFALSSRFANAAPITARQIMAHQSGIPSDVTQGKLRPWPDPLDRTVRTVTAQHLAYPPGTVTAYSNVAMNVLAQVVEKRSGRGLSAYVREQLFMPLEMRETSLDQVPDASSIATGYVDGAPYEVLPARDVAASSLISTSLDMAKLVRAIFAGGAPVLERRSLDAMFAPQNTNIPSDLDIRFGLNWFLSPPFPIRATAGRVVSHTGGVVSHFSNLVMLPDKQLGVIVLTNASGGRQAMRNIAQEAVYAMLAYRYGIEPPADEARGDPIALPRGELEKYVGVYDTEGGLVPVTLRGDSLRAVFDGTELTLTSLAGGTFSATYKLLGLVPIVPEVLQKMRLSFVPVGGQMFLAEGPAGRRTRVGARLEKVPIPESWSRRAGSYRNVSSADVGDRVSVSLVEVFLRDGYLIARMTFTAGTPNDVVIERALAPSSPDSAYLLGVGAARGDTLEWTSACGEARLRFSGHTFERVEEAPD